MNIGEHNVGIHRDTIINSVFKYAYENAKLGNILTESSTVWYGEKFDVSTLDTTFSKDIKYYLKREGLYKKIKETTDKFIILPDVFSEQLFPKEYYRKDLDNESGVKDYGTSNVVILNGKVFELLDRKLNGVKFCYSGKMYYFYDSTNPISRLIDSDTPTFRVMDTKPYTEYSYSKFQIGTEVKGSFILNLDIDNKVAAPGTVDYLTMKVGYPFIEYDYNIESIVDVTPALGLIGVTPEDFDLQYKLEDEREEKFIIHNRSVIFTNTAIVVYKDGEYSICNSIDTTFMHRVDKHTVEFGRSIEIDKIIVFYKPIVFDTTIERVDSLYDDIMKISEYGYYDLAFHQKDTTELLEYMMNSTISIDWLVEYGYKYDLDVLRAIQKPFPGTRIIPSSNLFIAKGLPNYPSKEYQLFLNIPNILNRIPVLFINGIMFPSDTRITRNGSSSILHINLLNYDTVLNSKLKSGEDITKLMQEYVFTVAYMPWVANGNREILYPKEFRPTLDNKTPAVVVSVSEDESKCLFFVDGLAAIFSGNTSPFITRQHIYDIGMSDDCKFRLLFSRLAKPNAMFSKLNLPMNCVRLVYNDINSGVFTTDKYFSDDSTIFFNSLGNLDYSINIIDNSHCNITSKTRGMDNLEILAVRIPRVDVIENIDLEIDYSKVYPTNKGSYNESVISLKPDILRYFKTDTYIREENKMKVIDLDTSIKLTDLIATFGSIGNRPFNSDDYRKFLKLNSINVINNRDLMPYINMIPSEYQYMIKEYGLARKIISTMCMTKCLRLKYGRVQHIDSSAVDLNVPKQWSYHLSKYGLEYSPTIRNVATEMDYSIEYTDDFNNPPELPTDPLETQITECNIGGDYGTTVTNQHHIDVLKINGGDVDD